MSCAPPQERKDKSMHDPNLIGYETEEKERVGKDSLSFLKHTPVCFCQAHTIFDTCSLPPLRFPFTFYYFPSLN